VRVGAQAVCSANGAIDARATIEALRPALDAGVNTLWFPVTAHLGLETSRDVAVYLEELAGLLDADWSR
jgi:hypothetical protein